MYYFRKENLKRNMSKNYISSPQKLKITKTLRPVSLYEKHCLNQIYKSTWQPDEPHQSWQSRGSGFSYQTRPSGWRGGGPSPNVNSGDEGRGRTRWSGGGNWSGNSPPGKVSIPPAKRPTHITITNLYNENFYIYKNNQINTTRAGLRSHSFA